VSDSASDNSVPDYFDVRLPTGFSRRLREVLTAAAQAHPDPKIARMFSDAASGRISMRDFVTTPAIQSLAVAGIEGYEECRSGLSPEERARQDHDADEVAAAVLRPIDGAHE